MNSTELVLRHQLQLAPRATPTGLTRGSIKPGPNGEQEAKVPEY